MNIPLYKELRLAVEDILAFLIKDGKYDKIIKELHDLLNNNWQSESKDAIEEAINTFENKNGDMTEKDANKVLDKLKSKLGEGNYGSALTTKVAAIQTEIYTIATKDVIFDYAFGKRDLKTLKWLKNDSTYWIGTYYDRELQDAIQKNIEWTIQQGMSKSEAGTYLRQMFGEQFQKSQSYWEGLSNHIVTRTREFGKIAGYQAGGIQKVEYRALLGPHTCDICLELNGTIFDVGQLIDQRDAIMAAATPEAAKEVAPWLKLEDIKGLNPAELAEKGVVMPPVHFHCHCTTIAYFDEAV
jgi:hypothetical protein